MTYFELINQFWRRNCDVHFTASATCLYFYLLNECNTQRWPETFHIPTSIIVDELKISRPTFISARNALVETGLIEVRTSQGKSDSRYRIVDAEICGKGRKKKTKEPEVPEAPNVPETPKYEDNQNGKYDVEYVSSLVKLFNKMSITEFTSAGIVLLEELVKNIDKSTEQLVKSLVKSLVKKFDKFTLYIKDNKTIIQYYATLRIEQPQGQLFNPDDNPEEKKKKPPLPDPPTYEEVRNQFLLSHADTRLQNWELELRSFYDWFNFRDWKDRSGNSILRKWQTRANIWINDKESEEQKVKPTNPTRPHVTTITSRQSDTDAAQQKRDESYSRVMRDLLSNPDPGSTEMP